MKAVQPFSSSKDGSKVFTLFLSLLLMFFISVSTGFAQEDLGQLSLEELLNVKVVTASKSAQSIKDAPAIMTVVTANDIENFGASTLGQVLDRLTNMYLISTSFAPNGMLVMRGKQTEHYNTNVLLLFDGRPLRESFNGGYNAVIFENFPVSAIQQIEIIRGPGSVLYGTNAYLGVINIITKTPDKSTFNGRVTYGSFGTAQLEVFGAQKFGDLSFSGGVNWLSDPGWDFTARGEKQVIRNKANTADSLLTPLTTKYSVQGVGAQLKVQYKDFQVNSFFASNAMGSMGRTPAWNNPKDYKLRNTRSLVDAGYKYQVSSDVDLNFNVTYNHFEYDSYNPSYTDVYTNRYSDDFVAEVTGFIHPSSKLNIVFGGLTNSQSGGATQRDLDANGNSFDLSKGTINSNPWITVPQYSQTWFSAYFQAEYSPFDLVKFVLGGQVNKVTGLDLDFVPRLGAVFTFTPSFSAKVLYGQAFRSATAFEREAKSPPSVYGYQGLIPEKIKTFETQVNYSTKRFDVSLTYFNNSEENLISRSLTSDSLVVIIFQGKKTSLQQYINKGTYQSSGFEFDGRASLSENLSVVAGASIITGEDNKGAKDIYGTPKTMVKFGVSGNFDPVDFGIYDSYFGDLPSILVYDTKGKLLTKTVNPEAKAYHFVTANFGLNLKKLFNTASFPNIKFNLYVTNLFNSEIYYPEVVRKNINSLPGRPPRAVYGSISVTF